MQRTKHPDGPIDQIVDISHLSVRSKAARREAYAKWVLPGGKLTTAAGKELDFDLGRDDGHDGMRRMTWKRDGNVSVAQISCHRCAEINSCRKRGTPPFICLVRADNKVFREDGSCCCAYCSCTQRNEFCKAMKARQGDVTQSRKAAIVEKTSSAKKTRGPQNPLFSGDSTDSDDSSSASESEDNKDEEWNGVTSKSGRKVRPVNRYPATQALQLYRSKQKRSSSASRDESSKKKGRRAELVEVSICVPKATIKEEQEEQNEGFGRNTESKEKQREVHVTKGGEKNKDTEMNIDKNGRAERAREVRQRCIKTASQLLALELAELDAELGES